MEPGHPRGEDPTDGYTLLKLFGSYRLPFNLEVGALERRVLSRSWLRRGAAWWFVVPAGASVIAVIGAIKLTHHPAFPAWPFLAAAMIFGLIALFLASVGLYAVMSFAVSDRIEGVDLYTADEIFLTGSATEVIPIREVDGRMFEPGPITQTLQQRYTDICHGRDEKYLDWLDFVE